MAGKKGMRRKTPYPTGANHPRWQGGPRIKKCAYCGSEFRPRKTEPNSMFQKRKFCCKACADKGGFRYSGKEHPNYRPESRRKNRGGSHHKWVNAVISRDKATCQHCGAQGVELHAHHIKSYRDHPELRFDVSNGLTLCHRCHWNLHAASNAKAVNSGNIPPGQAEDNPEPSFGRKPIEGVTTRGRAYRRWVGECAWCKTFICKRWSDTKGKRFLFCSKVCAGKHNANIRFNGSNASTSAAPERDEIV